jgi:hypothetical protein
MKKFKCLFNRIFISILFVCLGISSFAQFAGSVDTTFAPNNNGVPFSTSGYYKAAGVEVIGNSVYYALQCEPGYPKIRKYDFQGNEDVNWYNNQMSTWNTQFATTYLEPEKDTDGNYTGKFFICGRNSYNSMVNQGVRFLNKINADGTRDLSFVCPYTSWISVCTTIYHDWENGILYYSYRNGYGTVVLVSCDPNTGQILQTLTLPGVNNNYSINKITKIEGVDGIIVGGSFDFQYNNNYYVGLFKLDSQFNILPINGVTNVSNNFAIYDIISVNGSECDGTLTGSAKIYIAGSISEVSGNTGFKNIARFNLLNDFWQIDQNYKPGCAGGVYDICYYNCHLIATGNFASSTSNGSNSPFWSPKVTAFTSSGQVSDEFKMNLIGSGLGGVYVSGFENNFGQGTGRCLAVNPNSDGNDRWEIFIGGTFVNLIQGPTPRNVIKHVNFMAKLHGFDNSIDTKFTYCLDDNNSNGYSISTFDISNTLGCEKWELYKSESIPFNWNLIRTENTHDFSDTTLTNNTWYKLVRTVTECGNSCSSGYIIYKESQNCQISNGVELRTLVVSSDDYKEIKKIEDENSDLNVFPNPTSGVLTIRDNFNNEFRNVSLYNSLGSKVMSKNYNSNNYSIDITDLPNGVYMLVITTDIGVQKQQIIKQ